MIIVAWWCTLRLEGKPAGWEPFVRRAPLADHLAESRRQPPNALMADLGFQVEGQAQSLTGLYIRTRKV